MSLPSRNRRIVSSQDEASVLQLMSLAENLCALTGGLPVSFYHPVCELLLQLQRCRVCAHMDSQACSESGGDGRRCSVRAQSYSVPPRPRLGCWPIEPPYELQRVDPRTPCCLDSYFTRQGAEAWRYLGVGRQRAAGMRFVSKTNLAYATTSSSLEIKFGTLAL